MALGQLLREAREKKGCSIRDVAEGTNMMVQMVEELEEENFNRIAAPIYGKGFIRLYSEFIGIDPAPLVDEYMSLHAQSQKPTMNSAATRGDSFPEADQSVQPAEERRATAPPAPVAPATPPAADVPAPTDASESPAERSQSTSEAPRATQAAISNDPDDLFGYAQKRPQTQSIKPSLIVGQESKRPKPEKPKKPKKPKSSKEEIAAIRRARLAALRSRLSILGSVNVFLRAIFKKMPLRDLTVVLFVVTMLALTVIGVKSCMDRAQDNTTEPAPSVEIERLMDPPDPYCE